AALGRELRKQHGGDILLFVDQIEELCTLAKPEEAALAAEALYALACATGGVRLLATVRSDFLGRLAALPGLGDVIASAFYLLRPLSPERLREAIVGPARAKGVSFESAALVDTLVEEAARAEGGLPFLQFALAELWDARDVERRRIPASALSAIG